MIQIHKNHQSAFQRSEQSVFALDRNARHPIQQHIPRVINYLDLIPARQRGEAKKLARIPRRENGIVRFIENPSALPERKSNETRLRLSERME
jgi:hypothetical protein